MHDPIGRAWSGGSERDDTTPAYASQAGHGPLQILRMVFPPVDDDDVLDPAAHEKLAVRHEAEIACVQPTVPDRLRCRLLHLRSTRA